MSRILGVERFPKSHIHKKELTDEWNYSSVEQLKVYDSHNTNMIAASCILTIQFVKYENDALVV